MLAIRLWVCFACVSLIFSAGTQTRHWTETPNETIWRGRYKNCDHGYWVNLPPKVVGHGARSPSPNHGILISARDPGVTTEVTLEASRLVDVFDSADAVELGSARAYLNEYELKAANESESVAILEQRDTKFRSFTAVYVHFRKTNGNWSSEEEALVIQRKPKQIGPLFIVIVLRTTPEFYRHDHALFLQIRDGLHFVSVPRGECSND
jgi:hypothetical protein